MKWFEAERENSLTSISLLVSLCVQILLHTWINVCIYMSATLDIIKLSYFSLKSRETLWVANYCYLQKNKWKRNHIS